MDVIGTVAVLVAVAAIPVIAAVITTVFGICFLVIPNLCVEIAVAISVCVRAVAVIPVILGIGAVTTAAVVVPAVATTAIQRVRTRRTTEQTVLLA